MSTLVTRPGLAPVVDGVRAVVEQGETAARTAWKLADMLRVNLPGAGILSPDERVGDPERYRQHVLHVEPGGSFSVVAVVWLPGQVTPVHDHVSWCVFGVLQGIEHETLYRVEGGHLVEIGSADNLPGEVSGFAPPGDIHRVKNTSHLTAISLHIYGADIGRLGTSVRRTYDLPVRGESSGR